MSLTTLFLSEYAYALAITSSAFFEVYLLYLLDFGIAMCSIELRKLPKSTSAPFQDSFDSARLSGFDSALLLALSSVSIGLHLLLFDRHAIDPTGLLSG